MLPLRWLFKAAERPSCFNFPLCFPREQHSSSGRRVSRRAVLQSCARKLEPTDAEIDENVIRHTFLSSRRHGGSHYALPNRNGTSCSLTRRIESQFVSTVVGVNKYRLATMHGKRHHTVAGCNRLTDDAPLAVHVRNTHGTFPLGWHYTGFFLAHHDNDEQTTSTVPLGRSRRCRSRSERSYGTQRKRQRQ